jgi:hypothetical protein
LRFAGGNNQRLIVINARASPSCAKSIEIWRIVTKSRMAAMAYAISVPMPINPVQRRHRSRPRRRNLASISKPDIL